MLMVCSTSAVASCGFCPSSIGHFLRAVSEGFHSFLLVFRIIWISGIVKEKNKILSKVCSCSYSVCFQSHLPHID